LELEQVANTLRADIPSLLGPVEPPRPPAGDLMGQVPSIAEGIRQRVTAIHAQLSATLDTYSDAIDAATDMLLRWMVEGKVVRVIGAGRARLAAAIPANRIAHGGAQVYVQDDIIPMPHTIRGGGLIAASASGRTESVLAVLQSTRLYSRDVEVLGIAASSATEFASLCDVFIGIESAPPEIYNPLRALLDFRIFAGCRDEHGQFPAGGPA
jgi:D-arabinose 5-phosphate isomerase GutQ